MQTKQSKISTANVKQMRADYAAGLATQGELSRRYRLSVNQVGKIVRGEAHQDIPDELSPENFQRNVERSLERLHRLTPDIPIRTMTQEELDADRPPEAVDYPAPSTKFTVPQAIADRAKAFGAVHIQGDEEAQDE